jgi:uncharacterized protein YggE
MALQPGPGLFPALIIAAIDLAIGFLPAATQAQERMVEPRTITVRGTGRVLACPDVAEVYVGVVADNAMAIAAIRESKEATDKLTRTLHDRGIADKDIRTTQMHVLPRYTQPPSRRTGPGEQAEESSPRIRGYRVESLVRITIRAIDTLGPTLDGVMEGGINQIRGISFRVGRCDELLIEARKQAIEDARKKAQEIAVSAQVRLGPPLRIEEYDALSQAALPRIYAGGPMVAATPSMPILPGEQDLTVTVSAVYELLPKN